MVVCSPLCTGLFIPRYIEFVCNIAQFVFGGLIAAMNLSLAKCVAGSELHKDVLFGSLSLTDQQQMEHQCCSDC